MFRISNASASLVVDVDTVQEIEPEIRSLRPGRYHIDEFPAKPFPSGHTARRLGCRD
jgi:hypothetical protein